jgi:hypothetical protein
MHQLDLLRHHPDCSRGLLELRVRQLDLQRHLQGQRRR